MKSYVKEKQFIDSPEEDSSMDIQPGAQNQHWSLGICNPFYTLGRAAHISSSYSNPIKTSELYMPVVSTPEIIVTFFTRRAR